MAFRISPSGFASIGVLVLLLATIASASQAIHGIKTHSKNEIQPRVVVPGEYAYREAKQQKTISSGVGAEVIMDSTARVVKSRSGLMRKEDAQDHASFLVTDRVQSKRDLYVKVGDSLCDGDGGLWKRYEMTSVTPGRFDWCAPACDQKEECLGFDVGDTGCNLYTLKAVAVGSWPYVRFQGAEAFPGEGSHDDYPSAPSDLTVGSSTFGTEKNFKCYRKSYVRPLHSYYRKVGLGTCSGGGLWKRYRYPEGTEVQCRDACDKREECIGFDHNAGDCFLYTQKAIHGLWPNVEQAPLDGEGAHAGFAPTPFDLTVQENANATVACWSKTHWVSLASYYTILGQKPCAGGKHYKITGGDIEDCKSKCDEKAECVGLDFTSTECRLFISAAVTGWSGVEDSSGGPYAGTGDLDIFVPRAFDLSPGSGAAVDGEFCMAKTHTEPPSGTATATVAR